MNCPKCQEEIHEMKLEGVEVDFCSSCKGIWFDGDEMAFIMELPFDMPQIEEVKKEATKTDFKCPRCGDKLEEMRFVQSNDLLVDRCPSCRGIWLDKGEYSKVEDIASNIGDAKSKIMMACRYFKEHGYEILGVRYKK